MSQYTDEADTARETLRDTLYAIAKRRLTKLRIEFVAMFPGHTLAIKEYNAKTIVTLDGYILNVNVHGDPLLAHGYFDRSRRVPGLLFVKDAIDEVNEICGDDVCHPHITIRSNRT